MWHDVSVNKSLYGNERETPSTRSALIAHDWLLNVTAWVVRLEGKRIPCVLGVLLGSVGGPRSWRCVVVSALDRGAGACAGRIRGTVSWVRRAYLRGCVCGWDALVELRRGGRMTRCVVRVSHDELRRGWVSLEGCVAGGAREGGIGPWTETLSKC